MSIHLYAPFLYTIYKKIMKQKEDGMKYITPDVKSIRYPEGNSPHKAETDIKRRPTGNSRIKQRPTSHRFRWPWFRVFTSVSQSVTDVCCCVNNELDIWRVKKLIGLSPTRRGPRMIRIIKRSTDARQEGREGTRAEEQRQYDQSQNLYRERRFSYGAFKFVKVWQVALIPSVGFRNERALVCETSSLYATKVNGNVKWSAISNTAYISFPHFESLKLEE